MAIPWKQKKVEEDKLTLAFVRTIAYNRDRKLIGGDISWQKPRISTRGSNRK